MRENIKSTFGELIVSLKARESELLRELDNILASYLSYRIELERVNEQKTAQGNDNKLSSKSNS